MQTDDLNEVTANENEDGAPDATNSNDDGNGIAVDQNGDGDDGETGLRIVSAKSDHVEFADATVEIPPLSAEFTAEENNNDEMPDVEEIDLENEQPPPESVDAPHDQTVINENDLDDIETIVVINEPNGEAIDDIENDTNAERLTTPINPEETVENNIETTNETDIPVDMEDDENPIENVESERQDTDDPSAIDMNRDDERSLSAKSTQSTVGSRKNSPASSARGKSSGRNSAKSNEQTIQTNEDENANEVKLSVWYSSVCYLKVHFIHCEPTINQIQTCSRMTFRFIRFSITLELLYIDSASRGFVTLQFRSTH